MIRINAKNNEMTLEEFVNDRNINQCMTKICLNYATSNDCGLYFAYKMKTDMDTTTIFVNKKYDSSGNYELPFNSSYRNSDFFMDINYDNKTIIYSWDYFVPEEVIKDYKFYSIRSIKNKIYNDFNTILNKIMDDKFEELLKDESFLSCYNDRLTNYSEKRMINKYVFDNIDSNCEFNSVTNFAIEVKDIIENGTLNPLRDYINGEIDVKDLVDKYIAKYNESITSTYAYIMANRNTLKKIISNPTDKIIKFKNIAKSVNECNGKTLNVILKNGNNVKVENNIFKDYYEFRTVKGYNWIKFDDIQKITYGRNTIFEDK